MFLFYICCVVVLFFVDLGFNWIGGLGSLCIFLFLLFCLLYCYDLEIIEIFENGLSNFVLIIFLFDDRSVIMFFVG